jgi:hypothetical protein
MFTEVFEKKFAEVKVPLPHFTIPEAFGTVPL